MNKKITLLLTALSVVCVSFAQEIYEYEELDTIPAAAQQQAVSLPSDSIGIHPWNGEENDNHIIISDQSHWSIFLGAGFNMFDGDYTSEKKHAVWFPAASLGATYHWNNTWGVGAEYTFNNYKVTGSDILKSDGTRRDAEVMLKGMSHQADAFVTFDIFNAFRPQNKRKVFALDVILGGGAIFKKNSIYYGNGRLMSQILKDTPWDYNTGDRERADKLKEEQGIQRKNNINGTQWDTKYKAYGVFLGGVSAEFNINRSLQLGLRAIYNYTTSDEIDGRPYRGQNNDGILDCELLIRYKFEPRQKSNVRNFMVDKTIDNWNDGTYYEDPAIGKAKRDKYKKPTDGRCDTLYIITRDTVWMMGAGAGAGAIAGAGVGAAVAGSDKDIKDYVVYFENDVPELDKVAVATTTEAADCLKSNMDRKTVVIGSCDNTGAVAYNQWLAVQRANNVTRTLKDLGVGAERIYTVGRGIMQDDRAEGSYSVNRRVEIRIVTDQEFEQAKLDYAYFEQYKNAKKVSAVRKAGEGKLASSSEILRAAIENMKETGVAVPFDAVVDALLEETESMIDEENPVVNSSNDAQAQDDSSIEVNEVDTTLVASEFVTPLDSTQILAIVEVTSNMTLSKLARKYYNNTDMWVKIFEANQEVLASPDLLEEGMRLVIPKL